MKTQSDTSKELATLGFSLTSSAPTGAVEKDSGKNWPHLAYTVTLSLNGKEIYSGPYSLGIGHIDLMTANPNSLQMTGEQSGFLHAWKKRPHANFLNQELQAKVAEIVAKKQGVKPELSGVLHSLLMDGEAHFSSASFEDWADEFGYDHDSRKAEKTFTACVEIGRKLSRGVPSETLSIARTILADH